MGSRNNLLESLFSGWTGIADTSLTVDKPAEDVLSILEKKMKNPKNSRVAAGNLSWSRGWSVLEKNEIGTNLKAKNGDIVFFISVDVRSEKESDLHIRAVPEEGKLLSNFFTTLGNPDVQTDRLVSYLLEGFQTP